MTGLDKIIQQIQDEARKAAEETRVQAKREADEIALEAAQKAKAQTRAIEAQSKTDVENALSAAESAAQLAKRRAVLAAKQEIIGEVIADAQSSVFSLPDAAYFELILKMAAKYALSGKGQIHFSAADLKRLPNDFEASLSKAAGELTLSREPRTINGGFILVYGGIEENCSIEALFYAAREELQDKVSQLLFS